MSLAAGHRLGPYEILAALGSGGMGEVFRARDSLVRLDREVALQGSPPGRRPGPLPARALRARSEGSGRASIIPTSSPCTDIGEDQGILYIVSELVPGRTLRGAAFPLRKTLDIAPQIAEGLDAAHTAGVTHRDLKPENVMVTPEGRAKILDFGLAKRTSKTSVDSPTETVATGPGTVMVTVGYMSPEQVRGEEAGPRSDIFSFGAVLYELLSGERAFKAETAVETMHPILKADPPELAPSIPEGLPRSCRSLLGEEFSATLSIGQGFGLRSARIERENGDNYVSSFARHTGEASAALDVRGRACSRTAAWNRRRRNCGAALGRQLGRQWQSRSPLALHERFGGGELSGLFSRRQIRGVFSRRDSKGHRGARIRFLGPGNRCPLAYREHL